MTLTNTAADLTIGSAATAGGAGNLTLTTSTAAAT
jgi:hypothetical protein